MAEGDLAGALKSYRDTFTIIDRLAKADPGHTGWQRDLAVSFSELALVAIRRQSKGTRLFAASPGDHQSISVAPNPAMRPTHEL